jgi:hypothetical protein
MTDCVRAVCAPFGVGPLATTQPERIARRRSAQDKRYQSSGAGFFVGAASQLLVELLE